MYRFPFLSLKEQGRLNHMPLRKNSVERVFDLQKNATVSCGLLHG